MRPTSDAAEALARLRTARSEPAFTDLVHRHGIDLLVVFGSVLDPAAQPADLDLAVGHQGQADLTALLEDLYRLTGYERFDLLDLVSAGIVARGVALGDACLLYESRTGLFAETQVVALALLWDTRWLRDLELSQLAGGAPVSSP